MGLVADVFDVVIKKANGDVLGRTELQDANIEVSQDTNDVRAGKGNGLYAILHSNQDININLTDVVWDLKSVALHLGQEVITGEATAWAMPKDYQVSNDGTDDKITLDNTPISEADLVIHDKDGELIADSNYLLSGSDVTFSGGVAVGDWVTVQTYKYTTDATAETVKIEQDKFPKDVMIVLETLEIDQNESPKSKIQYQFDRTKPSASFSINTSSERNANTHESSFRVMKPKHTSEVGRVIKIPIA